MPYLPAVYDRYAQRTLQTYTHDISLRHFAVYSSAKTVSVDAKTQNQPRSPFSKYPCMVSKSSRTFYLPVFFFSRRFLLALPQYSPFCMWTCVYFLLYFYTSCLLSLGPFETLRFQSSVSRTFFVLFYGVRSRTFTVSASKSVKRAWRSSGKGRKKNQGGGGVARSRVVSYLTKQKRCKFRKRKKRRE